MRFPELVTKGQTIAEQCSNCIHMRPNASCKAFPDRIPDEIFFDEFDHTKAHIGDHGVRFEQK